MKKQRSGAASKLSAFLLSFMMAAVFMPTFAFADEGTAADDITVYMTVSDQGVIAKTKDGDAMAWKEVTVKDLDASGDFTFDEALVAAHQQYNSEDGYAAKKNSYGGSVTKLWGTETTNTLFLVNGAGISTGVGTDTVANGDYLTASVNKDSKYYADWFAAFDKTKVSVPVGESISLNLQGHLGMAYTEEDKADIGLKNIQIGIWDNGNFSQKDDLMTDAEGNVSLTFDTPGTYILTGAGVVEDAVTDWNLMGMGSDNTPPFGVMDYTTYDTEIAYTEADYGDGPYPADEIKYIDFFEEADESSDNDYAWQDLYYLKSNQVIADCPIMAPACIVTVPEPAEDITVSMTISDEGVLAKTKDGDAMVNKDVTVSDLNKDGKLTYSEALVAAHKEYCAEGEAGYAYDMSYGSAWVTKLWGKSPAAGSSFMKNDNASSSTVDVTELEEGDVLLASNNLDSNYYADWNTYFDKKQAEVKAGEKLNLTLKGYQAMTVNEPAPAAYIQIGLWEDGNFKAIDGLQTDENGLVEISFDNPGTYIVTANGTVKDQVLPWGATEAFEYDCPMIAPYCIVTVKSASSSGGGTTPAITKKEATTELNTTVTEAETVNSAEYTAESYQALEDAIAAAKAVAADPNSTVEDIQKANAAVEAAKTALVKAEVTEGSEVIVADNTYQISETAGQEETSQGTVTLLHVEDAKSVTVPKTVILSDGKTYKVTAVGTAAFAGSKAATVTLTANIKTLEPKSFTKSKVKTIIIKSKKLTKASVKNCLKGSKVKTIKVKVGSKKQNKKFIKKYKKIFTKKNAGKKVKIK